MREELIVLLLSLLPSVEPRYAIVIGVSLGMPLHKALLVGAASNLILSVVLVLVADKALRVLKALSAKRGPLGRLASRYLSARDKLASRMKMGYEKWGLAALIAFIALPLPATGVYTGALAAVTLGITGAKLLAVLVIGGLLSMLITASAAAGYIIVGGL